MKIKQKEREKKKKQRKFFIDHAIQYWAIGLVQWNTC